MVNKLTTDKCILIKINKNARKLANNRYTSKITEQKFLFNYLESTKVIFRGVEKQDTILENQHIILNFTLNNCNYYSSLSLTLPVGILSCN